ncbi:MAG: type IV secretory system conjugative DNA transfer family protein [Bacilli bacterium]|nr:type IV secretory system conjugative DNA transfer family protein [Bacilli bacterium]
MKLKFRAEPKDILYFVLFVIFLFFLISVGVGNITSLARTGEFIGFNPLPGLSPENIVGTVLFFVLSLGAILMLVSSYFFDREKGFGIVNEKKQSGGYSKWAKVEDIKTAIGVKEVNESDKYYDAGGVPLYSEKGKIWVDDGESHSLIIGSTGSGKTYCIVNPLVHILAKHGESMVITDPKGEIYEKNAEFLRDRGYKIVLLNFRNPQKGNMWNPLSLPYKLYKNENFDKCNELLRDLAINILHDEKTDDPFWQNTSADYFVALAQGLFQDADEKDINISSIINMLTVGEEKYGGSTFAKEYFKLKDSRNPAYINAAGTIDAPSDTKGSIISVFRQKINIFAMAENLSEMLSKSDFDMMDIGREKTAVFLIIQDEKKTYHALTTIFVKQCYESLIDVAQESGGKLRVRTNFILDEFANMPELKDVTTMITAARSRQIRFNLIIQNFAQLNQVYGKENAETIKGNCTNMIYLLSSELTALEEISKLCGDVKVKGKGKDKPDETRPLISVSDLQRLKFKDAIIKKQRIDPFKTTIKGVDEYDWNIPQYEKSGYPSRKKESVSIFDLKGFVKEKRNNALNETTSAPSNIIRPNIPMPPMYPRRPESPFPIPQSNSISKSKDEEFDVDELIKKIDAKIAELEKEEEENKRKETLKNETKLDSVSEIKLDKEFEKDVKVPSYNKEDLQKIVEPTEEAVKVNENIDNIIKKIEDEEVSDDQFFDDFFFDE